MTTAYNTRDLPAAVTGPLGETIQTTYDAVERPVTVTDPLTRAITNTYDADGVAISATAPMNRVTATAYVLEPGQPRQVTTTNPLNHASISQYDAAGQHRFLTNRNGQVFEMTYDLLGRLTQTIQPGGRTHAIAYAWNATGLQQTVTEPSGQSTTLQHNARGHLVSRAGADATTTYTYDPNGNLLTVTEGAAVLTRVYEADRDLVSSYTNAQGEVIGYAYDANGNLTTLTYPGGRQVHYAYDSNDRLVSVTDWAQRVTTFEYDLSSRLTAVRRANGTARLLAYDAAGQLLAMRELAPGGGLIAYQGWRYDAGGRPDSRARSPQPAAFTSPVFTASYHPDNRLNTVTPDGGSAVTVSSDLDGNLLSAPLWEPTQSWNNATFTWDARNRLTGAATANGAVAYSYDAEGHLMTRTENGQTTRYTVNPNAALSQALIAHHPDDSKTFYVYGATGLLYEENFDDNGVSQGTRSYHGDQVGSTIALTDDAGQVTGRLEYTAYGLTSHVSGNVDTPFRYNGAYGVLTDPATGLLHMRARWYSPGLGRFLSEDPIGFSGGLNWYAYADGNPINLLDPFGLWSWSEVAWNFTKGVVVGAAITAAIVVAAPVVVSVGAAALVTAGVTAASATTISTAVVTVGITATAAVGTAATAVNTYKAAQSGNWNAVAFNAGSLVGGLAVGAGGGGRALAEGMMGKPSPAPNTWNPVTVLKYEHAARYQSNYPGGNLLSWLASAPTPAHGGTSAALTSAGAASFIPK